MINEDALRSIEKLHEMKAAGMLSEEEFAAAKQDLLHGKSKVKRGPAISVPDQQGEPTMEEHLQWALLPLRRYAQFEGRSSRKEYWMFLLLVNLVVAALAIIIITDFRDYGIDGIGRIAAAVLGTGLLAACIPFIAVEVRRFHDQGRSGWFVLLNLIPYIGWIIVLIFMIVPGVEGENEYGPDPLA